MIPRLLKCVCFLYILAFVRSGYPPQGDEVQMGSVLLPATRRGRYLANIVRRQAVDGTGIKFNKDADRMNAEAKKKVDVLSEELLPYIIAEQERRTTLYKRVMTAIQNGEKGVTIAEIRNKPPLIIRKGLMYRCPANRAPKEPDGSGIIMCEMNIEPTAIVYDSCLSAEDKELYVAENRYFFCNRHNKEGPDLPRNSTTVMSCSPHERTSLNYTTGRCALEDTDDVVVHFRYYPDKTYKFVTELDPDHEVCDHWNPCQIGYIFSLPSPDQALPANELFSGSVPDECEKIVPQDDPNEYVPESQRDYYQTSPRRIAVPDGYQFHGVGKMTSSQGRSRLSVLDKVLANVPNLKVVAYPLPKLSERRRRRHGKSRRQENPADPSAAPDEGNHEEENHEEDNHEEDNQEEENHELESQEDYKFVTIRLIFTPLYPENMTTYYARFSNKTNPESYKFVDLVILHPATIPTVLQELSLLPGQVMNATKVLLQCGRCALKHIMVRAFDGGITNLDGDRYRVRTEMESDGRERKFVEIDLGKTGFQDFGDYFIVVQTEDGNEEKYKVLTVENALGSDMKCVRQTRSVAVGEHVDNSVSYECSECVCSDVVCNGESVLSSGRVSVVTANKFISFNFPSFENENACVYIGIFKDANEKTYRRVLQVIDNASVEIEKVEVSPLPLPGSQFEHEIPYTCKGDCSIDNVTLNGVPLEMSTRRTATAVGIAFYVYSPTALTIRITSFSPFFYGIYQALFSTPEGPVTKTVMEIKDPEDTSGDAPAEEEASEPPAEEEAAAESEGETPPAPEGAGETAESPPDEASTTEEPPPERRKGDEAMTTEMHTVTETEGTTKAE